MEEGCKIRVEDIEKTDCGGSVRNLLTRADLFPYVLSSMFSRVHHRHHHHAHSATAAMCLRLK
jgi:hypothetical protein